MAKRFNFDEAITTDIKGAASDSYRCWHRRIQNRIK